MHRDFSTAWSKLEDNVQQSVLFFHYVGSGNQIQVIRSSGKCLHLVSLCASLWPCHECLEASKYLLICDGLWMPSRANQTFSESSSSRHVGALFFCVFWSKLWPWEFPSTHTVAYNHPSSLGAWCPLLTSGVADRYVGHIHTYTENTCIHQVKHLRG